MPDHAYEYLVPIALEARKQGRVISDVMREIYGVDLPREVYELERSMTYGLELPVRMMFHPWELIAAHRTGRASPDDPWAREQELRARVYLPTFLPLLMLAEGDAELDDFLLGYDLVQLAAGESVIWGHRGDLPQEKPVLKVIGASLLAVLHEWASDWLRMVRAQYESPRNFGAGSLTSDDVSEVALKLKAIEKLQRKLSQA